MGHRRAAGVRAEQRVVVCEPVVVVHGEPLRCDWGVGR